MNIKKPIPVHKLPYWDYIDKCKFRLAAVLA